MGSVSEPSGGPIKLAAALDPKLWGGRALERFGFELPADTRIGEALLTGAVARVLDGPLAGRELGELAARYPHWLCGERGMTATGGRTIFPLLTKIIDARDVLSVQVHPDDDAARALGGVGKTEAWHVLGAEPGSRLYVGLRDPGSMAELERRSRAGERTGELLRELIAVSGETLLIPAGTIHALGAGLLIYEIQQPSGITYRFDDWGRRGIDGRSRELHIEQSLAVAKPALQPAPIPPIAIGPGRTLLVACDYFSLERIVLSSGASAAIDHAGSPAVVIVFEGDGRIEAGGSSAVLRAGETVVIAAGDLPGTITAASPLTALHGWV